MDVANFRDVEPLTGIQLDTMANRFTEEVIRQDHLARAGKFGGAHVLVSGPDEVRLPVLMEEVGEVARELNEGIIHGGTDRTNLLAELIQVGACALAWAAAIDRQ